MPFQQNQPKRSADAELIDQIRSLYAEGATLKELSCDLGLSDEMIRRMMVAAGIKRRPRGQPVGKYLPSGGRTVDKNGYVLVKADGHPHANNSGYCREHRLVMEKVLGRYLRPEEVVHHVNGDTSDNRIDNLQLYENNAAHKRDDLLGNSYALGDVNNPKRRVKNVRSEVQMLDAIREFAATLKRPVQRNDLVPPLPSYRTVARAFGSWQEAVALALDDEYRATIEAERGPFSSVRKSER